MLTPPYQYRLTDVRVIDGDTVEATLDYGRRITQRDKFRLVGINTPELHALDPEPGRKAKAYLERLVAEYGGVFLAQTVVDKNDKYGRLLIRLVGEDQYGERCDLNERMLASGHAVAYDP